MSHPIIRDYLRISTKADSHGPADVELLTRFVNSRDETAFELLVWRHAALIQRVCRSVLGDYHAAEDAAQATFLILARKAHTFSGRGSAVGWLYRIARRVAFRLAKERALSPIASNSLDRVPIAQQAASASPDEVEALCLEVDCLPSGTRFRSYSASSRGLLIRKHSPHWLAYRYDCRPSGGPRTCWLAAYPAKGWVWRQLFSLYQPVILWAARHRRLLRSPFV